MVDAGNEKCPAAFLFPTRPKGAQASQGPTHLSDGGADAGGQG